ncbi:MAG: FAD:protein FMN transferase [Candidatus Omnitrophota bacterium]|nr:FAD:protein FMN transferase [Candidatus Omnitrophota bacterium]MDZ4243462.1 FAD:protein FMN transferase [Candidatus Omnitrophota bacterium]
MVKNLSAIVFLLVFFCVGCGGPAGEKTLAKYREKKLLMGTYIQVDVCYEVSQEPALAKSYARVWALMEHVNADMNVYNDKSDVARVNRSFRDPVPVGADTYGVIESSLKFNLLTGGAFDITVRPLIVLWKKAADNQRLPSADEIAGARRAIGPAQIRLGPDHRVELLHPQSSIDLGGIAAGYAIDEAAKILREEGFQSFYIDIGGDIYAGGRNCEGRPWRIGIRDPRFPSRFAGIVEIENAAITTSGNYEKYYEVNGQRWSHIINPVTGFPQKGVVSSTVIAPTALENDALSTALCVLPPREGLDLIKSLGDRYACLIFAMPGDALQTYQSDSFPVFRAREK